MKSSNLSELKLHLPHFFIIEKDGIPVETTRMTSQSVCLVSVDMGRWVGEWVVLGFPP